MTSGAPGVDPEDVVRELAVARHAARAGAPVVPPCEEVDPGPHRHAGRTLVFWRYVERVGPLDPVAAGAGLRAIHEALADYEGPLPPASRTSQVREMVAALPPSADAELLAELASRELPARQALHGDAHLFNCLRGSTGLRWHDFETACRGPREFDLAALVQRQRIHGDNPESGAALAAYGKFDADLLEAALPVYSAWITASWLIAVPRRPELAAPAERQLAFLRRHRT